MKMISLKRAWEWLVTAAICLYAVLFVHEEDDRDE